MTDQPQITGQVDLADEPGADWWERLYDGTPDTSEPPRRTADEDQEPAADEPAGAAVERKSDEDQADDQAVADEDQEEAEDAPESGEEPKKPLVKRPDGERVVDIARDQLSRQSLVLLYNGSAAGAGWALGLVDLVNGWIADCGAEYSIGAAVILGCLVITGAVVGIDARSRAWWPPLAWCCRIPLASAVLALGLYAPASAV